MILSALFRFITTHSRNHVPLQKRGEGGGKKTGKKSGILRGNMIAILPLFLLPFAGCTTTSRIGTDNWRDYFKPGHTKEEIARDFNLYRGKWWNYYVRGRWFAEGGFYDEAAQDFRKAISLRSQDQRSARSYGMHFWEYFAHRELGVIYYHQGKYEDAKKELEMSRSTADSARAKYYLNKSNEAMIKMTKMDIKPPEIRITSHTNGQVVNTPAAHIRGVATDDAYVNGMSIQGRRLFIELAERNLSFDETVSLQRGENVISIEATDLSDKSARQDMKLMLDLRPPVLYLDDIRIQKRDGRNSAIVTGTITDDHGVQRLSINDTEIPITPGKEVKFQHEIVLTDGHTFSLRAVDVAGNETRGEESLDVKASLWRGGIWDGHTRHTHRTKGAPVMVAAGKLDRADVRRLLATGGTTTQPSPAGASHGGTENPGKGSGVASGSHETARDTIPPVIYTDLKSAIVHDTNIFFGIHAHDDNGIARLFVNQQPLDIRPAKHVFFNHLLTLNEGENTVVVKAVDREGNETELAPVKITKKAFYLLETEARYTVALLPFRTFEEDQALTETLYSLLLRAFDEEPKRFNFVERDLTKLEEILREQKIANTELTSPDAAIKVGKIRAADGMLFGAVEEDSRGISVTLRLVDTETTQVLVNVDVYDEDKNAQNLAWLMHGLSLKVKRQYPLVQGSVIRIAGNGFHVDAGATSGMLVGMKLLMFREVPVGNLVLKEPLDSVARIVQVQPDTSFARISTKGIKTIKKKDLVITK